LYSKAPFFGGAGGAGGAILALRFSFEGALTSFTYPT
jgi:hypothetical protein